MSHVAVFGGSGFLGSYVADELANRGHKVLIADLKESKYLKNGQELGAEGVERIVKNLNDITPKNIVDSIASELNWGIEKLRDDITCLALDLKNTDIIKKNKKN